MPTNSFRRTIVACAPWAAGLAAATLTSVAQAHVGAYGLAHHHGAFDSFTAGAAHPLTGLDHLAAMVSVGLWSALSLGGKATSSAASARHLLSAPLAFAATLLIGALMALNGITLPGVEPMIAASLLALGLLVATRTALPTSLGAALVAGFALFHGLAHGQELGGHASAALTGMVLSTLALHMAGIGFGLALRQRSRWLPRIAGIGVATFGLGLLSPAIAGVF